MNGLQELLKEREDGIVERWVADTLAAYPGEGARAFARERDRFANPVGHSVRVGTRVIVTTLLEGGDDDAIARALNDILQIRAVQQLAPAAAVGFLFHLKQLIRDALGGEGGRFVSELADLDRRIDHAALTAFDLYVSYRELVYELRLNEAKRAISWTTRTVSRE